MDSRSMLDSLWRVSADLVNLHSIKSAAYGASWKKHGELVSIFANISRKMDRIEQLNQRGSVAETPDETALDTIADLAVYSLLYVAWLDDASVAATGQSKLARRPRTEQDAFGLAVELVLGAFARSALVARTLQSPESCIVGMELSYMHLERLLVPQASGASPVASPVAPKDKLPDVVNLALYAMGWLAHAQVTLPDAYLTWAVQWGSH